MKGGKAFTSFSPILGSTFGFKIGPEDWVFDAISAEVQPCS